MKEKTLRGIQIFWSYFIGIGALAGALGFFISPEMMGAEGLLPPMLARLPMFAGMLQSLVWPGVALLCVNCLTNVVALVFIHKRKPAGRWLSLACGIILMLWICMEFYVFNGFPAACIAYFIFGALQTVGAVLWLRCYRRTTQSA